jgi:hypothetical protein
MPTEINSNDQETRKYKVAYRGGASDAVYAFGLFGAWFYYLSTATTFWEGLLGIIKGFFWPGFLVYEIMKYLHL